MLESLAPARAAEKSYRMVTAAADIDDLIAQLRAAKEAVDPQYLVNRGNVLEGPAA